MRPGRWLLAGIVSLAVLIAGVLTWRQLNRPEDQVRAVAERAAAALAERRLDPTVFDGVGDPEVKELAGIVQGMGTLRPVVTVGDVGLDPDGHAANVRLAFDWTIHAGKPSWRYDSFLTLRQGTDGWRAAWSRTLLQPQLKPGWRLRAVRLAAARGEIIGARDERFFWNQEANRVGIDRTRIVPDKVESSARALAKLLGVDADRYAARVVKAGSKAFVEVRVLRAQGADATLGAKALRIPGVRLVPTVRSMPATDGFAAPVLGTVGDATAEIVAANPEVREGDVVGLTGLQASRNAKLMGVTGFRVLQYEGANPTVEEELFRVDPKAGSSLQVTLDGKAQRAAERILAGVGPASALVAIRPSDGALLAVASGPGSKGYSTAARGLSAPGSSFKTVSVLAALRGGLAPSATVTCSPSITVDGKRFDNHDGFPASGLGKVPLRTAFADSCNTAMIRLGGKVSQQDLVDAAASLGLGETPQLGVKAALGTVPVAATEVEHAASMIGQGEVLASPLGMATVAASIAAGRTVTPYLLADSRPAPGPSTLEADEARTLRSLMREVTVRGTGRILASVPGEPVLSKTGTAGYGTPVRYRAWMIAAQGDLAVAVFVADGDSGATTAGPLVKKFLLALG